MSSAKIQVSGSNLQWIDTVASVTRSICGAIPVTMPSGFSGQTSGKIWIASDDLDDNLYYSDGGGQTRFIEGISRGTTTTLGSGRIYVQDGDCTDGTELVWTTPSASAVLVRSARAQGVLESQLATVFWSFDYNNWDNSGAINYFRMENFVPAIRDAVTVGGLTVEVYNNSGCTGGVVATIQIPVSNQLTLNVGQTAVSASVGTGYYSGNYFKLLTGSMYIDSNNPALPNVYYCNGIDYLAAIVTAEGRDGGVCFAVPGTSGTARCGTSCVTGPTGNSTCDDANDGCSACSAPYGGGTGICYNPSSPPPPPPPPVCGGQCTPKTASQVCPSSCPICCNGACSSKCVS